MVKFNELASVFTLVNAVGEEIGDLNVSWGIIFGVSWDDVVAITGDEGNTPHVGVEIAPSPDDGLTIE